MVSLMFHQSYDDPAVAPQAKAVPQNVGFIALSSIYHKPNS